MAEGGTGVLDGGTDVGESVAVGRVAEGIGVLVTAGVLVGTFGTYRRCPA